MKNFNTERRNDVTHAKHTNNKVLQVNVNKMLTHPFNAQAVYYNTTDSDSKMDSTIHEE